MKSICAIILLALAVLPAGAVSGIADTQSLQQISKQLALELKSQTAAKGGKLTLAVLDFPYYDGFASVASANISEGFTVNLANAGVSVVERKLISAVLVEKKLEASGVFDPAKVSELGKMAGASAVLTGTIEDLDGEATKINLRIVDTESGLLLVGGEFTIARTWEKHRAELKQKTSDGKIALTINFEPEQQAGEGSQLPMPEEVKLDFSGVDIDKLEKYDKTVKLEKNSTDYLLIAASWDELAGELPEYKAVAGANAAKWRAYDASLKTYEQAMQKRAAARWRDYTKLSKLLAMDVVTPAQKDEFAGKFVDAYGTDNDYYKKVKKYLTTTCVNNGKTGFCYSDGTVALPGNYDYALPFSEGLAAVRIGNRRGYIDKKGKLIIPLENYDSVSSFSEGLAQVSVGWKWGFINKNGEKVISPEYEQVGDFSEDLAPVRLNGRWGFIDKSGNVAIPLKYDSTSVFADGRSLVNLGGKYGFVNRSGVEITPVKYDHIDLFHEGLAKVQLGDRYGFIDGTGKEVVAPIYNNACYFSEGLAFVQSNTKCGFIDRNGNAVIPIENSCGIRTSDIVFSGGLAPAYNGALHWGYIDRTGATVLPFEYYNAESFQDGVALVDVGTPPYPYELIDRSGAKIKDYLPYQTVDNFNEGFAKVHVTGQQTLMGIQTNWTEGFINKTGDTVVGAIYDGVGSFKDGLVEVTLGNKHGFVDTTGGAVIPVKYDRAEDFVGGLAKVTLNGKSGYVDKWGREYFIN
jgi:hypothetical protein